MDYYTLQEASKKLKVHENTMLKWLNKGIVKGVKFGHLWRIPDSEIDRFGAKK
jgi:excisionase family DNA binding protein